MVGHSKCWIVFCGFSISCSPLEPTIDLERSKALEYHGPDLTSERWSHTWCCKFKPFLAIRLTYSSHYFSSWFKMYPRYMLFVVIIAAICFRRYCPKMCTRSSAAKQIKCIFINFLNISSSHNLAVL